MVMRGNTKKIPGMLGIVYNYDNIGPLSILHN